MEIVINIEQLIGKLEIINLPCADGTHSDLCREHLEKQLNQAVESSLSAVLGAAKSAADSKPEPDYEKIYQELKRSPTKADMVAKWEELQKQGFKTSYREFCHNISRINQEKMIRGQSGAEEKD